MYISLQPTDSPVPTSVQDADKVIEDLRNTLKEVENERYDFVTYPWN